MRGVKSGRMCVACGASVHHPETYRSVYAWEDVRGVWGKWERMLGMRESCLTACRVWQLLCVGFLCLRLPYVGLPLKHGVAVRGLPCRSREITANGLYRE